MTVRLLAGACALAFLTLQPVHAASTLIAGPGSYGAAATTVAEEPDLAGMVLEDRVQPFTITGGFGGSATGSIQERVVRSNDTGTLIFAWRVNFDTIAGFDPGAYIEWLNLDPIATGNPLAVGRRSDGVGSPTSTNYDLAAMGQSRFDFNLIDLDAGNVGFGTQFHYLKTDATNYALTGQLSLTGHEFDPQTLTAVSLSSGWLPTWAPSAAVPEPAIWLQMILGVGLIGAVVRRKREVGSMVRAVRV